MLDHLVGDHTSLGELYPGYRASFALGNLIKCLGLIEIVVGANAEELAEGFEERCNDISEWCLAQCGELMVFGQSYDEGS